MRPVAGRPVGAAGQPDPEAAGRQPEQHRAGPFQVGHPPAAQLLELGEAARVAVRAGRARLGQFQGIGPHLGAGLAQEAPGGHPVQRLQRAVLPGRGRVAPLEFGVLRADPDGQHLVDPAVVRLPEGAHLRVAELRVADHREQRLGQVVVDVGVHAEQDVPHRREVRLGRGCAEGHRPRLGHRVTAPGGVQGVQVQPGEGDVPAVHPPGVGEGPVAQRLRHRLGGAQVGRVEGQPAIAVPAEFPRQGGHPFDHIVNAHARPPERQRPWYRAPPEILRWAGQ